MLESIKYAATGLFLVLSFAVQIETVTVNPLCPTNKIAPHRRVARFENSQPRTFGEFYNLLRPTSLQGAPSSLQEKPQEDDPDDCGEIEDYDENDLSSITPQSLRRHGHKNDRFYGLFNFNNHNNHIINRPTIPPKRPTRPPVGGYFGNNAYRPPKPLEPTDYVKPVHEEGHEEGYRPHTTYRPGLVGAPIGHIVGLPQVKPTAPPRHAFESTTYKKPHSVNNLRTSTQSNVNSYKHHRPRNADAGILGSFIDLLL